jgi:hypothetical protein
MLHDSGSVPLIVRIVTLPFAALGVVACYLIARDGGTRSDPTHGHPLVAFAVAALLVLFFVELWFWRAWILFDGERGALVRKHRGLFGVSYKRTPVIDIVQVYVRPVHIRAQLSWDIGVVLGSGERQWLTRLADEPEAKQLARSLCEVLGRPQAA